MNRLSNYVRRTAVAVAAVLAVGCHNDKRSAGGSGGGGSFLSVSIGGASMQSGFARGSLRPERTLPAFQIGKNPVTWGEFTACVQSGKCAKPEPSGCLPDAYVGYAGYRLLPYDQQADDTPAACVGTKQAESYCRSVGGRLPTLDEWLLAARGPSPTRFSWGDSTVSSDQHPLADDLLAHQSGGKTDLGALGPGPRPVADLAELGVGKHPAGASPSGIEDVLLTPGELLASDPDVLFSACATAGGHCVVYGVEPAAIDAVAPVYQLAQGASAAAEQAEGAARAYGFRCVSSTNHEVAQ